MVGEYEQPARLRKVSKPAGLYPLSEVGVYGPVPRYIPGYQRRVCKPKKYAAYGGGGGDR